MAEFTNGGEAAPGSGVNPDSNPCLQTCRKTAVSTGDGSRDRAPLGAGRPQFMVVEYYCKEKMGKHFLWNGGYRGHSGRGKKFGERGREWEEQTKEA